MNSTLTILLEVRIICTVHTIVHILITLLIRSFGGKGLSQRTIFGPRERFLDPPPLLSILYMNFQRFSIKLVFFQVRSRHFLGRALRLVPARGPSAAATWSSYIHVLHLRSMYKIDRRGGGSKNRSLGSYLCEIKVLIYILWVSIDKKSK